jgi:hypothetical protein
MEMIRRAFVVLVLAVLTLTSFRAVAQSSVSLDFWDFCVKLGDYNNLGKTYHVIYCVNDETQTEMYWYIPH